jgi:hypothetical protein
MEEMEVRSDVRLKFLHHGDRSGPLERGSPFIDVGFCDIPYNMRQCKSLTATNQPVRRVLTFPLRRPSP